MQPTAANQGHERLVEAVAGIVTGADWAAMLAVAARFHRYSPANVLMVLRQAPEATRVAGYATWKRLGRQVKRGERGITIWAPVWREEDGRRVVGGYRLVKVFDISQTDGPDLPEVLPAQLDDCCGAELLDAVGEAIASRGFELRDGSCGGANGLTDYAARLVVVEPRLKEAARLKTLVHELAHVELHQMDGRGREVKEIEAESVAHLTCATLGVVTDAYSFPYVARWSGGDLTLVRSTAEVVLRCARRLSAEIAALAGDVLERPDELHLQGRKRVEQLSLGQLDAAPVVGDAVGDAGGRHDGGAQQLGDREPGLGVAGLQGGGGEAGEEGLGG